MNVFSFILTNRCHAPLTVHRSDGVFCSNYYIYCITATNREYTVLLYIKYCFENCSYVNQFNHYKNSVM